ncbi:uncharacterized protein [Argopecten irradians]|uniref:uncharacterized protein n=1 Tax=Argopecten irradians TaxID=31199 RepID=UPI0037205776
MPIRKPKTNPINNDSSLPTPICVPVFLSYLEGYPKDKYLFLETGFKDGFTLQYQSAREFRISDNLKSALDHPLILRQKIDKEIQLGRVQSPFSTPPFPNLQVSPLGLVPKKEPNEFRVIHHLSYPEGSSINDGIDPKEATVSYQTIGNAIQLTKRFGKGALLAKTDIESAFRLIPIRPQDYELLGFKIDDQFYYDKVLPMGCSISCRLFEAFSTAVHWIAENKFQVSGIVHILDDFLFVAPPFSSKSQRDLDQFLQFCQLSKIPIEQSKTVNPCTTLTFLGIELDSDLMVARLPMDKVFKARDLLATFLSRKKVTLRELQSLIGLLNFACKVISPGRIFLRRLINLTCGVQQPHHYVRSTRQAKADLRTWQVFLNSFNGVSMFLADRWVLASTLHFFTDASNLGFGATFNNAWCFGSWPKEFLLYHITIKEFFAIVLAIEIWGPALKNQCVILHCDNMANMAVVEIINKQTSRDSTLMKLTRRFVVASLRDNILFKAQHIPGKHNILADHLSRLQVDLFRQQAPRMARHPTPVPDRLMVI